MRMNTASASTSRPTSHSMAARTAEPASVRAASATPSRRNRPCAIVIVVLATITDGTLSSSGERSRSSQALTTSPPSAAVGVTMLNASPASRVVSSTVNGTRSRRNA